MLQPTTPKLPVVGLLNGEPVYEVNAMPQMATTPQRPIPATVEFDLNDLLDDCIDLIEDTDVVMNDLKRAIASNAEVREECGTTTLSKAARHEQLTTQLAVASLLHINLRAIVVTADEVLS